jgi:hypothetical protein
MHKSVLPAVLAAALASALAPASARAGGEPFRRYAPAYPRYDPAARYAPPARPAPGYPPESPGDAPPAACRGGRVAAVIDRLAEDLQTLREDVGVELPDARGRALAALADDLADQAEHLRRDLRDGDPAEHLWKHAAAVDRGLHEFLEATEALGEDGRFLRRSARRIEGLDHALMRLLSPGADPEARER